MEPEILLSEAVRAGLLDAEKGRAALAVYQQAQKMGAHFAFRDFLIERGLVSGMALAALEARGSRPVASVDTVGDFQLLELLGEGEHGVVFGALQKSLNRKVAVKILSTELAADAAAVAAFLNEARATARVAHPHMVQVFAAGSDAGLHYLAMELVDGGSARALLAQHQGRLPEALALDLARQAAEGLQAAHAAGFLHGDIKPDNLLLTRDGQVKLTDLGIAQALHPQTRTEGGVFWGSPPYVPPEVIRGGAPPDARSDIYSLGATLFELLLGAPPYVAETPEQVLRLHLEAPVPEPLRLRRDLHFQTAALLKSMLAKDPARRPASAQALVEALGRILAQFKGRVAFKPALKFPARRPYGARPGTPPRTQPPAFKKPMPRPPAAGQPPAPKRPLPGRPGPRRGNPPYRFKKPG